MGLVSRWHRRCQLHAAHFSSWLTQAQLRKIVRVRRAEPQSSGRTATTLASDAGSDAEREAHVWLLSESV